MKQNQLQNSVNQNALNQNVLCKGLYYPQIAMIFVALLLTANIIGEKPLLLGPIILPAGLLLFPITYLLGDLLTEVYGFAQSRRVIWMAMVCNLFMAAMCKIAIALPALETWGRAEAYAEVLGTSSRLMAISVFTYFVGELTNAYIVSKLKVRLQGRLFWARALCGSWIGEGVETGLFIPLVFYGSMPNEQLLKLAGFYYSFKVLYVLCAMPFLNFLVKILKKREYTQDVAGVQKQQAANHSQHTTKNIILDPLEST